MLHIPRFRVIAKARSFRRSSSSSQTRLRWALLGERSENLGSLRIMQASTEVLLGSLFYPISQVTQLALPSVACSHTSFCIVQFSRCQHSSLFQDQIETSAPRCFDPFLTSYWKLFSLPFPFKKKEVVGPSGLAPPTSRLSVVRSSQLSYGPVVVAKSAPLTTVFPIVRYAPLLLLSRSNPLLWALNGYPRECTL